MASVFCALFVFIVHSSTSIPGVLLESTPVGAACHHGDMVYLLGTQWTVPGYCRWFLCQEDNQIVEKGCPEQELQEGCYMSEYDFSQDYPSCCPQLNCPDQQEIILQDWVNH